MEKQDLQKEYFVTARELIRSVHFDVAELANNGIAVTDVMREVMEMIREETDKIMEQSHKCVQELPHRRGIRPTCLSPFPGDDDDSI